MTTSTEPAHEPETWYWEAGSDQCPHGPEPDNNSPDWDDWSERHQWSPQDVFVCLDAPSGHMCGTCSEEDGEGVPWSACRARSHAAPKPGTEPAPDSHEPVEVWVGTTECLERECEDYFDDEGDEIPGKERCSHIGVELICGGCSTRHPDGYYEPAIPWPGPHAAVAQVVAP